MTRLPNGRHAVVDLRKLEDYCLNPGHPRGRHKARVFRDALGIGRFDALWLRRVILEAAHTGVAVELASDAYGVRWQIDFRIERQGKTCMIRSIWMVRAGEAISRFITCWVQ